MDKEKKINELDITDEFIMADSKESISEIARKLQKLQHESEHGAILITQNKEVIGFITDNEIIDFVADGKNLVEMYAYELMNTDYVEVLEDEELIDIMPLISKRYPNAIIVINSKRQCVGYLSKSDYKDLMAGHGVYDKSHKPETKEDWRIKGIAMSSLGKKVEALKCFEKSVESSSDQEKGWSDLAKRLERLNRLKDSIMCYDKVLSINSDNETALTEKGNIYSKEKSENLAIHSYKMAVKLNPKNVDAWMNLGMEHTNQGEIEEAMKCFNEAQAIKGESAELWFRKGKAYDKSKQFEDALDCYENAIKMDKSFEDAWFNKGVVFNELGKEEEALQCLEDILNINPNNESAKEAIAYYKENKNFKFS